MKWNTIKVLLAQLGNSIKEATTDMLCSLFWFRVLVSALKHWLIKVITYKLRGELSLRGAIGGKTGKTSVLAGFCKIEGGGSHVI